MIEMISFSAVMTRLKAALLTIYMVSYSLRFVDLIASGCLFNDKLLSSLFDSIAK